MGISFNSADYYRKVADCAGCVQNVSEALVGLTGEMYKKWYFERCSFTYSFPGALLYEGALKIYRFGRVKKYINCDNPADFYDREDRSFGRYFPLLFARKDEPQNKVGFLRKWLLRQPTESPAKMTTSLIMKIINDNNMFWPLLPPRFRRIPARLYYARKIRSAKQNVLYFEDFETTRLVQHLEHGYQRATDKRLYLAQRVKELADKLAPSIPRFRDVRTNETLLTAESLSNPHRRFDPKRNPQDKASHVGITIASVLHFPKLLARFEQEMSAVKLVVEHPASYPWRSIDELAEEIELWANGGFLVTEKFVAQAGAGFIDALREAELLPKNDTLPTLYEAFSEHYKCSIKSDRMTDTRQKWHVKTRDMLVAKRDAKMG